MDNNSDINDNLKSIIMGKSNYNYDALPEETRLKIANLIKEDNFANSEKYYPQAVIKVSLYERYFKRIIDIIVSIFALLIFFPVNIIIGIVTFFDVGSPILFKQVRMGKKCKPFTLIKFRNMTDATYENGVLLRAEQRVTKWGHFVRKTSLDELLNFINILKGEMSVIGPRPLPLVYKGRFNSYHELRHSVKPGLDCPLRDPNKGMTWANRLENDVWYAQNVSFVTDMKMIAYLFRETFFSQNRSARADGFSEGTFMGYFENGEVMDSNHIPEDYYDQVINADELRRAI